MPCDAASTTGGPRPTNKTVIKAILFDLDGTLLDTEALSDTAMLTTFQPSISTEIMQERASDGYRLPWELKKQILGLRGSEWGPIVLSYARDHWNVPREKLPSVEELWKAWEENMSNLCEQVEACPGAPQLVDQLAAAGLPLAIATSSRAESVAKKRKRHDGMFAKIATIVPGDDPAVKRGKPSPDIYLKAARQLGVDPKECLVFEDALSGVRAGKAAGCMVVAVPDPRFDAEEKAVFSREADIIVDNLWSFQGSEFGIEMEAILPN